MDFSLILPSRERLNLLIGLIESVERTTANLENLEIWIAADWDDTTTIKEIRNLCRRFSFIQFVVTDRQGNLSEGYYNRLAKMCSGRFIQIMNDDCIFITPEWDKKALDVLEKYQIEHPDGILYGQVPDDLNAGYSCFPLLSRQAIQIMGWVFHPEMTAWGADQHLYEVYSKAGEITNLPYNIEHISHHTGKRVRDNINYRLGEISRYNYVSADGESHRLRKEIIRINGRKL